MKSPITGNEMELRMEPGFKMTFRKEEFTIVHHYWFCTDTGEQFTDDAIDDLDLGQVYNQYREKYGIPFPEEIKAIREKYGVSASKMSEILGLGANSWRNYEAGEVPSVANGRLILAVKNPEDFLRQVEASSELLSEKEKSALLHKVKHIQLQEQEKQQSEAEKIRVFSRFARPNQYNGYRTPSLEKAAQMVLYFAHEMPDLFKTKLNKLLFYADFLHFSRRGQSISGMEYRAIEFGPVPADYDKLLVRLSEDGQIALKEQSISDTDFTGEVVLATKPLELGILGPEEQAILQEITHRFAGLSAKKLVDISHREPGWKANVETKGLVSYREWGWFKASPLEPYED